MDRVHLTSRVPNSHRPSTLNENNGGRTLSGDGPVTRTVQGSMLLSLNSVT
jgi:hypothetical protein